MVIQVVISCSRIAGSDSSSSRLRSAGVGVHAAGTSTAFLPTVRYCTQGGGEARTDARRNRRAIHPAPFMTCFAVALGELGTSWSCCPCSAEQGIEMDPLLGLGKGRVEDVQSGVLFLRLVSVSRCIGGDMGRRVPAL